MTQLTKATIEATTLPVSSVPRLPGVVIRPFRDATDYQRLATVIRESNRADEIPWLPTVDHLRSELDNRTSLDPRRDVLIAEVDDQPIAMTGVERVVRDGAPVYEMWS